MGNNVFWIRTDEIQKHLIDIFNVDPLSYIKIEFQLISNNKCKFPKHGNIKQCDLRILFQMQIIKAISYF